MTWTRKSNGWWSACAPTPARSRATSRRCAASSKGRWSAGAGRAGRMIDSCAGRAITTGKFGFDDLKQVALSAMADIAQASLRALFGPAAAEAAAALGAGLLERAGSLSRACSARPGGRPAGRCQRGARLSRRRARAGTVRASQGGRIERMRRWRARRARRDRGRRRPQPSRSAVFASRAGKWRARCARR